MRLGIETVYQDLALAPDLDGSANLYLGREIMMPGILGRLGLLDNRAMRAGARKAFGELGVDLQNAQSRRGQSLRRPAPERRRGSLGGLGDMY